MDTITSIINWFGIIYVGIPLLSFLIILIYLATGRKIEQNVIDKIVDISKWYIASVAVVFAAKIVESSFSERETGIKEMQVYDKYVEKILEADNIEERWKLAQYFSTVTPTDRLRERWIAYKNIIEPDYQKFKELSAKENELLSQETLSPVQQTELSTVQLQKAPYERKLASKSSGNWVVVFTGDATLEESKFELNKLVRAGIENPRIYLKSNSYRIISKTFPSRQEAADYLQLNLQKIRSDAYVINKDTWCPDEIYNGVYYECK